MHAISNNNIEMINIILTYSNKIDLNVQLFFIEKLWKNTILDKSCVK